MGRHEAEQFGCNVKKPALHGNILAFSVSRIRLFAFGFHYFTAAVHTVGGNVVRAVYFAGYAVNRQRRRGQSVVRAVHTAFGRGFFVLLNGHFKLLDK